MQQGATTANAYLSCPVVEPILPVPSTFWFDVCLPELFQGQPGLCGPELLAFLFILSGVEVKLDEEPVGGEIEVVRSPDQEQADQCWV